MKKGIIKSINKKSLQVTIMGPINKNNIRREKKLVFQNLVCKNFEDKEIESLKYKIFNDFRKNYIGKEVEFTDYSMNKVDGVDIFFKGENIVYEYVKKGWLRLRTDINKKSLYYDKLSEISQEAEKNKRGIFSKDLSYTTYLKKDDVSNHMKKELSGYIMEITNKMYKIYVNECNMEILADFKFIRTPFISKENLENFISYYSQNIFLRDFKFILSEKKDDFFVIKIIINNDFNLLKIMLNSGYSKLIKEEIDKTDDKAYIKKLRDYLPLNKDIEIKIKNRNLVKAQVFEIHSGNLVSLKLQDDTIKRVFFANIRCKNLKSEELGAMEAKEFIRKLLIGKLVEVDFEYENEVNINENEKIKYENATLFLKGKNVSMIVLENGFANIQYSKQGTPVSKYINQYEEPLEIAKKFKRGIFDTELKKTRYWDFSIKENKKSMKQQINDNSFDNVKFGIVEYIISPEKIKLRVDKLKCYISLKLNSIKCVPNDNNNDLVLKYYNRSLEFLKELILQREIEFKVLNIDKFGIIHGNMYLNKENLSEILLKNGFAFLDKRRKNVPDNYLKAEEEAKNQLKNIWKEDFNFLDFVEEEKPSEVNKEDENKNKVIEVNITECLSPELIFASEKSRSQIKKIEEIVNKNKDNLQQVKDIKPKSLYLVLYNKSYNRGFILGKPKNKDEYNVKFVDYGNTCFRKSEMIKTMIPELAKIPYQTENIQLAHISCIKNDRNLENKTFDLINDFIGDVCFVKILYKKNNKKYGLFFRDKDSYETKDSLNYLLVQKGYSYLLNQEMENDPEWKDAIAEGLENNPDINDERDFN